MKQKYEAMKEENQASTELAEANRRLEHLNRVLKAIRNVNQLIVAENDPQRLIECACVNLTETMGYHNAWIALLGGEPARELGLPEAGPVAVSAASGFDGGFESLRERLERGDFPECMKRGLASDGTLVMDDPAVDCPDCPLRGEYGGRAGLVRRLEYGGVTRGILTASVPAPYARDDEEQALFNEVAGDLAFALYKIAAARKLEESHRYLDFVIEGSGVGTWEWNVQTNETRFNEQWAGMLGYTIEELTPYDHATWERLVHPGDIDQAIKAQADCAEGRTLGYSCEFRMKHKDGHWVWILSRGRIMTGDDAGRALAMFGTHTDITEQKRLQDQAIKAHSFLETVLDQSPFPMWVSDADGTIIRTNQALRETLNLTDAQLVGAYNVLQDKNLEREGRLEQVRRVYEQLETAHFVLSWKSGEAEGVDLVGAKDLYVDVSLFPIISEGKLRHVVCQWVNITSRVQAEGSLARHLAFEQAISAVSTRLLSAEMPDTVVTGAMEPLLEATGVSRVYIFENFEDSDDGLCMRQAFEVCAAGVEPEIDNPELQHVVYAQGFGRWRERLTQGEAIQGEVRAFPAEERAVLEPQGIVSMLVLPIVVGGRWWGFIGFDEVRQPRAWQDAEVSLLKTAAEMLGTFLTRKQAEQALRESEQRYRHLAEHMPVLINAITPREEFTYWNKTCETVTGYTSEEMVGNPGGFALVYPDPEYRKELKRKWEENQGIFHNEEFILRAKDGTKRTVLWSNLPSALGFSRQARWAVGIDITERKQAEESLRYSENLFRRVFDLLPVGIWIADKDGTLLQGNPAGVRIWGAEPLVSREEYGVFKARRLPSGEEVAPDDWALAHTVSEGVTIADELLEIDAFDGVKRVTVNYTTPVTDEAGNTLAAIVVNHDITEQYRAEEALRESEQRLRAVFSAVDGVPIQGYDENRRVIFWNPASEKLYGYTRDEAMGRPLEELIIPEEAREAVVEGIRQWHDQGVPVPAGEIELLNKNGERLQVYSNHVMITNHRGEKEMFCIDVDLTEIRRIERRMTFLAAVVENSDDIVVVKDLDLRVVATNPAFAKAAGHAAVDTMIGKTDAEIFGVTPDTEPIRSYMADERRAQTLPPGEYIRREQAVVTADAEVRTVLTKKYPIHDPSGSLIATGNISTDITEIKRAEQALRRSEAKFRALVDNTIDWIWETDANGTYTYASENVYEIVGYTSEELLGGTPFDFMDNEEAARVRSIFQEIARKHDRILNLEDTMLHKDGHPVVFETNATPLVDENGDLLGYFGTCRDITERKRIDDQLRLQSLVLDQIEDCVTITDLDGIITYINAAEVRKLGYSHDELIGVSTEFYGEDPERGATQRQIVAETLANGGWRGEVVNQNADGKEMLFDCRTQIVLDEQGNKVALAGIATDITERKQAEKELIRKQRSLDLYNRISDAFLTSPRDEVFSDVLDVILNLLDSRFGYFGYIDEAGDLVCPSMTREVWDKCQVAEKSIVFPQDSWSGLWGRSLMEKRTVVANENLRPPEGHVVLENALATPIVHRDTLIGQFVTANKAGGYDQEDWDLLEAAAAHTAPILFAIREEARQKTAHEKLEAQLRQAQKMEAVGRLAGGVAHDFNNMLSIVIGRADMILEEMEPDRPFYSDLMEIRQAGVRSADLTRQLLAFARKQTVAPKVIDLDKIVESMLKMLGRLIGEDIDMAWIPGGNVWPVKIDPGQIDQILANLCVNARDAIAGVGKVTIETGNTVFDEDYCRDHAGFAPGEYAMLAVSDDGRGMDAETLANIFDPFFTTKELGKGTGLGLATVYGVVKQNNGFINVYSEPDQGTTFKIYLPRHKAKTTPRPEKGPDKPSERGCETILLVEDEPSILIMITMMLERQGYKVVGAATPGEAIRLATERAGDIHLLMTDVVMPEMNGLDLAQNILTLYPRLKCVFMSGYTANVIAHHGVLDEGVNFIEKPFSKEELGVKVREALDEKKTGGAFFESGVSYDTRRTRL